MGQPHAARRALPADHWLLVGADGPIQGAQTDDPGPDWQRHDHRGRLLLPGFIDSHLHAPQLDVIGSWGATLLDWLQDYTFPAEMRHADPAVSQAGAAQFLDALLAHGTTAAVIFPTVRKSSADALFEAASARGMRVVAGKVLMDRNAPPALCDNSNNSDDVPGAERDCEELIHRWHGQGRNAYAVTVRFAITSSPAQLAMEEDGVPLGSLRSGQPARSPEFKAQGGPIQALNPVAPQRTRPPG